MLFELSEKYYSATYFVSRSQIKLNELTCMSWQSIVIVNYENLEIHTSNTNS